MGAKSRQSRLGDKARLARIVPGTEPRHRRRSPPPAAAASRATILPGDLVAIEDIVGIEKLDKGTICRTQPDIAGGARPRSRAVEEPDVSTGIAPRNVATRVGRTVIDDDDLQRAPALLKA